MKKIVFGLIMIFSIFSNSILATSYIPSANPSKANVNDFKTIAASVIGTLKWCGYAVAIGMLIYVGIKYTMAAADDKASMKGILVKVVIGSLIIAGSATIVDFILSISTSTST